MESQSWFLCLILSFGLIVLSDAQRPPYIPPPEYGRKRNAEDILQEKVLSADEDNLSYISPVEFGRKREINRRLMEKLRDHRHQ
ncbi:unnamed protein product [Porites lobata]|uniref:Uncharacterized protein n=1 Tax=Porites lobata TaxID=104759 RepID=A0ABN8S6G2_9CNID|nr:unnamed protein product [Porites lobata]